VELALFLLVLALVATWVSTPLRRGADTVPDVVDGSARLEREVRLAAIRDAELDAQMGKLSPEEHSELDARLRGEAIAALRSEARR
jgi:hypothetical protein